MGVVIKIQHEGFLWCSNWLVLWLWWISEATHLIKLQVTKYIFTNIWVQVKLQNLNKIDGLYLSVSCLWYHTIGLQNITLRGNFLECTQYLSVLFLIPACESIIYFKISQEIASIFAAKQMFVLKANFCHNHSQFTLETQTPRK